MRQGGSREFSALWYSCETTVIYTIHYWPEFLVDNDCVPIPNSRHIDKYCGVMYFEPGPHCSLELLDSGGLPSQLPKQLGLQARVTIPAHFDLWIWLYRHVCSHFMISKQKCLASPKQEQISCLSSSESFPLFWSLLLPTIQSVVSKGDFNTIGYQFNDGFFSCLSPGSKCEPSFVSVINPIKVFTSRPKSLSNANKQVQQRRKHGEDCEV